MNILDVNIWTTPLATYYVLPYDYNSYKAIEYSGIDLEDMKIKASYLQYSDVSITSLYDSSIENIILSVSYGDKLLTELERSGVVVRFLAKKSVPRFHETEWQKTNNIRRAVL